MQARESSKQKLIAGIQTCEAIVAGGVQHAHAVMGLDRSFRAYILKILAFMKDDADVQESLFRLIGALAAHIGRGRLIHGTLAMCILNLKADDPLLEKFDVQFDSNQLVSVKLEKIVGSNPTEETPYRSIVGSVMHTARYCRPDIIHSVQVLSRRLQNPTKADLKAAKHVLRYLKGTIDIGIQLRWIRKGKWFIITAYCDASHGDVVNGRSSYGYYIFLNGCLISWKATASRLSNLSSAESELVAATEATKTVKWVQDFLASLDLPVRRPSTLYIDNQSTLAMLKTNQISHANRHITVRLGFVRDCVNDGTICPKHIPTDDNLADLTTKNLAPAQFKRLRDFVFNPWTCPTILNDIDSVTVEEAAEEEQIEDI